MHAYLRLTALALAFVLAAGTSACSGAADDTRYTGPPRSGGTLRIGLDFDPVCLDPQQSTLSQRLNIGRQVVDSLTDQDPKTGRLDPWLAKSWTTDAKATRFTFRLLSGATFSDGEAVDAAAVKANLDAIHDLGVTSSRGAVHLAGYRSTEINPGALPGRDRRIRAVHPRVVPGQQGGQPGPQGWLPLGIVPLAARGLRLSEACRVLDRAREHDSFRNSFLRRPGRRGAHRSAGRRTVHPRRLPSPCAHRPRRVMSLYVNAERPALRDVRVRRALQKGIDRVAAAVAFLGSEDRAAIGVLSSTTPGYRDLAVGLAHDAAGAERLLDAARWWKGADGIRTRNGERLVVDAIFVRQQSLELIKEQYKEIGVELKLRQLTVNQFPQVLKSRDYDLTPGTPAEPTPTCSPPSSPTGSSRTRHGVGKPE
jgi:peptide/nickel transport system substrate-binding protein